MSEPILNEYAFPSPDDIASHYKGMSLLDYFAAHELLTEYEQSETHYPPRLAEALGGPRPTGNWDTNAVEFFKWDATIRAKMRYIRAQAMLKVRAEI